MSSLVVSLLPTLLSLWTLTPTNPVTGREWDRYLFPSCEELIPEPVRERWQLTRKPIPARYSSSSDCFFTRQGKDVTAIYECGRWSIESVDRYGKRMLDEKSIATWLAEQPRESVNEKIGDLYIKTHDDDTPCRVALFWPQTDGIDNARRFMKDLLAAATPSVVGKPKLEAVYLDPKSAQARAFFTSPAAWKKESAGLDGYITLPAGFPKVVDGKDFPGLPRGKVALVALCEAGPGSYGSNALPGLDSVLVDAPGIAPTCTQWAMSSPNWWELDEEAELRIGERTLSVDFFYGPGKNPSNELADRGKARAYLREADGSLVSIATDELPLVSEAYSRTCKATLKKAKAYVTLKVFCPLGTPDRCKKNPWWRFTQTVRVVGNKVTITHADERNSGEGCETTYE
jgi:hypothetical protein